ncbi:LOW QUALITY PROTEIN: uncharacterized protein [Amphiura filiformis]|uniref:LOW QUALITY PROTEIN: uncharacterized protein n=1 Tax=Amphiura filiformis TaxID=82378 RepID=UPI003B2171BF
MYQFEMCTYNSEKDVMQKDQLEAILQMCGASVVHHPTLFPFEADYYYIVLQPSEQYTEDDYDAISNKYKVPIISREWVLDSVATYTLQPVEKYLLSGDHQPEMVFASDMDTSNLDEVFETPNPVDPEIHCMHALSNDDSDFSNDDSDFSNDDSDYVPNSASESDQESEFESGSVPANSVTGTDKRKAQSRKNAVKKLCLEITNYAEAGNKCGKEVTSQQAASTPCKDLICLQTNSKASETPNDPVDQANTPSKEKMPSEPRCEDTKGSHTPRAYQKPYRYCIFCRKLWSKLRIHIEKMHKNEERVSKALQMEKHERDKTFGEFRREGIFELNKIRLRKNPENPKLERERRKDTNENDRVVMCHLCKAFIEKRYISRHEKKHCDTSDAACKSTPVPANMLNVGDHEFGGDFMKEILSKFREGENKDVYNTCTTDIVLLQVGKKLWNKQKRKVDKKNEVRKSIMSDMRRLASLYSNMKKAEETMGQLPVKDGNISDMFKRNNFRHFEEAVDMYTKVDISEGIEEVGVKAGLKVALYYLLKRTSKILRGMYLIDDEDKKSNDIANWVVILEINKDMIFGDAEYNLSKNREDKLRRPQTHPEEEDLQKVRSYTMKKISELGVLSSEVFDKHDFVELRDCLVSRLTLFNARRGGEPSRLKLKNWEEAHTGAWLDQRHVNNLDPLDRALAKTLKIGYETGKGGRHMQLVPVLFPQDCIVGLRRIADNNVRRQCEIPDTNLYLFPTKFDHVSGWHAVKNVCKKLTLKHADKITATQNRHRISTEFALMDVSPYDRDYVYKHLGHTEEVNRNVYQAPLSIKALTVVGRRLQALDRGAETAEQEVSEHEEMHDDPVSSTTESPEQEPSENVKQCDDPVSSTGGKTTQEEDDDVECSGRNYTHWNWKDCKVVLDHFEAYILGETRKKLPGKKEIRQFLTEHQDFKVKDWMVVRSKVMNEKSKREKLVRKLQGDQ